MNQEEKEALEKKTAEFEEWQKWKNKSRHKGQQPKVLFQPNGEAFVMKEDKERRR